MKNKILIIVMLLPVMGFCQPKGANQIIVHSVSLLQISDSLKARGFEIDKSADDSIITKPKKYFSRENDFKRDHASIIICIKIKGNAAVISGFYNYDELETKIYGPHMHTGKFTPVENIYSKASYMRRAFDYMDQFAKSLSLNPAYSKN